MASATNPTFWDVDTQYDFIQPDGKLYIDGAETILPNLRRLTDYARDAGIQVVGSVDWHAPDDPEISDDPDFLDTFPPHCLAETPGAEKVAETQPLNALWIPNEAQDRDALTERVRGSDGEVYLRKRRFDVFTNENIDAILDALAPKRLLVYGVALDVCDAHAIEGFLARGGIELYLALDATRAIDPERGEKLTANWTRRGVRVVTTNDVIGGKLAD